MWVRTCPGFDVAASFSLSLFQNMRRFEPGLKNTNAPGLLRVQSRYLFRNRTSNISLYQSMHLCNSPEYLKNRTCATVQNKASVF